MTQSYHAHAATSTAFRGFKPLSANFTQTPNQFFDRVVGHYHPCVVTVVAVLIRSTLGWADPDTGERRLEADLPLSAFVRPELSESSARKGIAGAIEAGFIVQTQPPTNKQAARYALRWEDAEAQKQAITRQRRAHRATARRGVAVMEPKWKRQSRGATVTPLDAEPGSGPDRGVTPTPLTVTPVTAAPPINKGVLKKSSSEKKKKKESERADFSTSSLGEGKEPEGSAPGAREGTGPREAEPEPAWRAAYRVLPDRERQGWGKRATLQAAALGIAPSDIPAISRIARELFQEHFERHSGEHSPEHSPEHSQGQAGHTGGGRGRP